VTILRPWRRQHGALDAGQWPRQPRAVHVRHRTARVPVAVLRTNEAAPRPLPKGRGTEWQRLRPAGPAVNVMYDMEQDLTNSGTKPGVRCAQGLCRVRKGMAYRSAPQPCESGTPRTPRGVTWPPPWTAEADPVTVTAWHHSTTPGPPARHRTARYLAVIGTGGEITGNQGFNSGDCMAATAISIMCWQRQAIGSVWPRPVLWPIPRPGPGAPSVFVRLPHATPLPSRATTGRDRLRRGAHYFATNTR